MYKPNLGFLGNLVCLSHGLQCSCKPDLGFLWSKHNLEFQSTLVWVPHRVSLSLVLTTSVEVAHSCQIPSLHFLRLTGVYIMLSK